MEHIYTSIPDTLQTSSVKRVPWVWGVYLKFHAVGVAHMPAIPHIF